MNQPTPPLVNCGTNGCSKSIEAQIRRNLKFKEQTTEAGTAKKGSPSGDESLPAQRRPAQPPNPEDLVEDLERFCRFRNDGEHALPANCDVFIYCSNGIGSFAFCPNGTKFNPSFLTCDHLVHHECRFDTRKLFSFLSTTLNYFTKAFWRAFKYCFKKAFLE